MLPHMAVIDERWGRRQRQLSERRRDMSRLLQRVCSFFNILYHIFLIFACFVLLAIVLIVSAQVVARQALGTSIRWSQEVALLLMVWMAFITCAVGVERGLHISIEMFLARFPEPFRKLMDQVNWILVILTGLLFLYYGSIQTMSTTSSTLPSTGWPKCTMYVIIPVSGFFIVYFGFLRLFRKEEWMPKPIFFEKEGENG